jgi:hypothetical protein
LVAPQRCPHLEFRPSILTTTPTHRLNGSPHSSFPPSFFLSLFFLSFVLPLCVLCVSVFQKTSCSIPCSRKRPQGTHSPPDRP